MSKTDDIRERLIALTRELVSIPGTSLRLDDLERCFGFVKSQVERTDGIEVKEHRWVGIPSLVAMPYGITVPEILLISHLDVIDHNDIGAYDTVVKSGKIFGSGCGDMKGAMSVMLELFSNFHKKYPGSSLGIAITSDEEQGGESGIGYLFDQVGLRCGLAINPDGGSLNEITVAEKGVMHLHVSCSGRSSHAARPWLGTNAVETLIEKIMDLKRYFSSLNTSSDNWRPTCSLTILNTSNTTINLVPAKAKANLDIRFPAPYTVDQIKAKTASILGDSIKIENILSAEPLELEPNHVFKSVIEEVTGEKASFVYEDGASDARFITRYGIPVVISRPVVGNVHAKDEWIDVESMVTFYRICERFLEQKLINGQ